MIYNNSVFTPTGQIKECGVSFAQWQANGNDKGTTVAAYSQLTDAAILAAASAALGW